MEIDGFEGQLVILSAGEEALQKEAQFMLDVLGKRTFFLGEAHVTHVRLLDV